MAFHASRRKLRPKEEEEIGELNIVPYLDIMMNLIMFMLLSMTGLVSFGVLNVASPKFGGPSAGVSNPDEANKPKLLLTVLVADTGFFIAGSGGVLPGEAPGAEADTKGTPTVGRDAKGEYDYAGLQAKIVDIKKAFPEETKIILGADAKISYDILVKTMDTCREFKGQQLFYDVSLTAM